MMHIPKVTKWIDQFSGSLKDQPSTYIYLNVLSLYLDYCLISQSKTFRSLILSVFWRALLNWILHWVSFCHLRNTARMHPFLCLSDTEVLIPAFIRFKISVFDKELQGLAWLIPVKTQHNTINNSACSSVSGYLTVLIQIKKTNKQNNYRFLLLLFLLFISTCFYLLCFNDLSVVLHVSCKVFIVVKCVQTLSYDDAQTTQHKLDDTSCT